VKCLIIIAHPNSKSFEHKNILPTIKMLYAKAGHLVEIIDLYSDGYNPSMFIGDISNINNNAFARSYRNSVKLSDHIYIISPTRWISLSPLIEGFIDQVFIKNFAYKQGTPLMKRKKLMIITTSTSNKSLKWKTCNLLWIRLRLMVFPTIFGFNNIRTIQLWNMKDATRIELNKSLTKAREKIKSIYKL